MGPIGSDVYKEYLADINRSGARLLNLINDVLDVSRIETGHFEVQLNDIAPAEIAAKVASLIRPLAKDKAIDLVFDLQDPLPLVRADARRLTQAVLNLMSNAVKYSDQNGQVRLSMRACPTRGWLDITVADDGIGMTPREAARAQRPFEQVDTRFARRYEGGGLGLYLARTFTEMMNGEFNLDSEKGRGTKVTVSIPVA